VKLQRRASRHLAYFALVDALAEAGCPVCTLGLRAVARYLDGLAYEQVNDPGVRAVLRAAHGFCTRHAWQFADLPHAHLGTAIIYRDIAATLSRGLTRRPLLPLAGWLAMGRNGALAPRRPCPACVVLHEASTTALRVLVGHLDDDDQELHQRYAISDGLCRPHLTAALPLARRPRTREILVATTATALDTAAEQSVATAMRVELLAGKEGAVSILAAEEQGRGRTAARHNLRRGRPRASLIARLAAPPDVAIVQQDMLPANGGCIACAGALAAANGVLRRLAERADTHRSDAASDVLCNRHAWRLVRLVPRAVEDAVPARLSLGAVSDGVSGGEGQVRRLSVWRTWRHRSSAGWRGSNCPICRVEAAAARAVLLSAGWTVSLDETPCCVPHTLLAIRAAPRRLAPRLLAAQAARLARLVDDLERTIRKHDYRFRDEPWGSAYDAPQRAVAHIAGARGLALRER